ncbi:flavin-containing monooxygenase [Nocardioides marmorisolisilvae]|uniref:NAD(P)/FAD-dependent oxidoreductase n=1 Tax=Nocardioides marmorisolisilvae TaxID=1542737 RepID=A0A3N0DQ94_9ACTN|nr:NAD(P)/FAD-dependent oxidoreductase [Nocardioides marmorisolisilvae]RNL77802.1 NAD(P)/FAD-dependent oxidoreductase [Nocardioides marmorisolisilvae]
MTSHHVDVLIIGAGISGIGTACRLRREHPERTIALIDRRQDIGGTWDLFRYPGIRSDSDMYSMAFEFRPWQQPQLLSDAGSIKEYLHETAVEYGVERLITFGRRVLRADWSSADARWTVAVEDVDSGRIEIWTCGFLATCTGYYNYDSGYLPEFPGSADFRGELVHPQFWPEDLDYAGKQVVVIGSGATAVTVVPAMAPTAGHVTMLQRSPTYMYNVPVRDTLAAALARVLPERAVYRFVKWRWVTFQRITFKACRRWPKVMRWWLLRSVRKQVGDGVDMAHFTPRYNPWDERVCAVSDGDLFAGVADGSISVVTDTIDQFTDSGVRLSSGAELPADVIVTATGLQVQMLGGFELYVDGERRDLHDQLVYKGVLIEGVPNLIWVFGYTNASWTLKVDIAGEYLCRLLSHLDDHGKAVVVARDHGDNLLDESMLDILDSGYARRARAVVPRQGKRDPWRMEMNYKLDVKVLLHDPIADGVLEFRDAPVNADAVA